MGKEDSNATALIVGVGLIYAFSKTTQGKEAIKKYAPDRLTQYGAGVSEGISGVVETAGSSLDRAQTIFNISTAFPDIPATVSNVIDRVKDSTRDIIPDIPDETIIDKIKDKLRGKDKSKTEKTTSTTGDIDYYGDVKTAFYTSAGVYGGAKILDAIRAKWMKDRTTTHITKAIIEAGAKKGGTKTIISTGAKKGAGALLSKVLTKKAAGAVVSKAVPVVGVLTSLPLLWEGGQYIGAKTEPPEFIKKLYYRYKGVEYKPVVLSAPAPKKIKFPSIVSAAVLEKITVPKQQQTSSGYAGRSSSYSTPAPKKTTGVKIGRSLYRGFSPAQISQMQQSRARKKEMYERAFGRPYPM